MPRFEIMTLALFSTIACSTAALAQPLDAARYVGRVLDEGLEARVAEAEAGLARAEAVGVGRWPNPSVAWQRESTGGGGSGAQDLFLASVPLVLSGRLGLEADAAQLRAEAGSLRLIRARALLHRDALDRFQQVLAANQRRAIFEDSLKVVDGLAEVITARQKAGEASGYDLLRIGLERSALQTALAGAVLAQSQVTAAALALLPQTAGGISFEGALATVVDDVSADGLESKRADLLALSLEAEAGEEDRRAAARGWIPEPVVSAGALTFGLGQPGTTAGYVVGVSLPLPFFQRRTGERAQGEAKKQLADARRKQLLHHTRLRLEATSSEVRARSAQLERHQTEVLPRAEQLRQVAGTAYRGGAAELLVLVDAERISRESRLTTVELQLQLAAAHNTLQLLAGSFDR